MKVARLLGFLLAALILKERVRRYRWTAVALGFAGVVVMMWPYLDIWGASYVGSTERTIGALCALAGAFLNAGTVIQTRRLTISETTASIYTLRTSSCATPTRPRCRNMSSYRARQWCRTRIARDKLRLLVA